MIKAPFHWQRNERSLEYEILDANNTVVAQIDSGLTAACQEASARAITNALNAQTQGSKRQAPEEAVQPIGRMPEGVSAVLDMHHVSNPADVKITNIEDPAVRS